MIKHANNMKIHHILVASLSIVFGTGSAMAGSGSDAQDQARAMLSRATAIHVDDAFVSSADSDVTSRDPQVRAQWLLAGKPRAAYLVESDSPDSVESLASAANDGTAGLDGLELARRILAGKKQ